MGPVQTPPQQTLAAPQGQPMIPPQPSGVPSNQTWLQQALAGILGHLGMGAVQNALRQAGGTPPAPQAPVTTPDTSGLAAAVAKQAEIQKAQAAQQMGKTTPAVILAAPQKKGKK